MLDIWVFVISGIYALEEPQRKHSWKWQHLYHDGDHIGVPELELSVTSRAHHHPYHISQEDGFDCELNALLAERIWSGQDN